MNKSQIKIIEYHIKNRMLINIERNMIEKELIVGFPLFVNDKILIISKIYDFHYEGEVIINTSDVSDAYSNESDVFYEYICKEEKLDQVTNPFKDAVDIYSSLLSINTKNQYATIQCEKNSTELYFSIGKIIEVSNEVVMMKVFDAEGKWENDMRKIPIAEITLISVGDYYSKMYYKYMEN